MTGYSYVDRVLMRFSGLKTVAGGWLACCPNPDHGKDGDQNPSLRISIGQSGTILVYCSVGCSFWDIMKGAGLSQPEMRPNPFIQEEPHPSMCERKPPEEAFPNQEIQDLLNQVYRRLLSLLPLEKSHTVDLLRRGIPRPEQDQRGYRSLRPHDGSRLAKELYKEFGDSLYQIPGFIEENSRPRLKQELTGLLIPVLSPTNQVVALKVRRPEDSPKYLYLSSHPIGRSPGTPIHYPTPALGQDRTRIRITEGELKADVATILSGLYTVGVPGVTNWWKVLPTLQDWSVTEVLVSFDWRDVRLKTPVAEQCLELIRALRSQGYTVGLEIWDPVHKGIDDCLVSGEGPGEIWDDVEEFLLSQPSLQEKPKKEEWIPCPFPTQVFPAPLVSFIQTVSKSLPCPEDFIGVPLLVASAAAMGNSRALKVKDSWTEHPVIWAVVVAHPGSMKTPSVKKVMRPLKKIQGEISQSFQEDHKNWQAEKEVYRARMSAYKSELRKFFQVFPHKTAEDPDAPTVPEPLRPEPQETTFLTDDVTLEGLAKALCCSPRGVFRETDEFLSIVLGFNQYRGKGSDRQGYLSLWSSSSIKVDRKGSASSLFVENPFFCLLGGLQPDRLGELEDEKGAQDGFLDRILFSFPQAEQIPELTFEEDLPPECEQIWESVIRTLRLLEMVPNDQGKLSPVIWTLSDEAKKSVRTWYQSHRAQALDPAFPKSLRGVWSKLKAYCVRFALVLHALRWACRQSGLTEEEVAEQIEPCDIQSAVALVDYFKEHCRGVYARLQFDRDDALIEDFVSWLKENGGKVSLVDVMNKPRWRVKGRESARKFLQKVADRGFGILEEEKRRGPGRPRTVFVLGDFEP